MLDDQTVRRILAMLAWYESSGMAETGGPMFRMLRREDGGGMVQGVKIIHGRLKGSLDSGDGTFTIDNVVAISGKSPVDGPSDTVEIANSHGWDGDDGAEVDAIWCKADNEWRAIQLDCPVPP